MGTSAQFEEKTFEGHVNGELRVWQIVSGISPALTYSPGQKLEELLGFDVMSRLDPSSELYAALFGNTTRGVGVPPSFHQHRPAGAVHGFYNLFFQYKRPTFFGPSHRSPHWPKKEAHYGFCTLHRKGFAQLKTLIGLEAKLGDKGLVRYVSPTTHTDLGLAALAQAGKVLATSTFVAPSKLKRKAPAPPPQPAPGLSTTQLAIATDRSVYHEWWRYALDDPSRGIPNPGDELVAADTAADIRRYVRDRVALTGGPPALPWAEGVDSLVREYVELTTADARWGDGDGEPNEPTHRHVQPVVEVGILEEMGSDRHLIPDADTPFVSAFLDVATLAHVLGTTWIIASAAGEPASGA